MVLELTQPLTDMSPRDISWGRGIGGGYVGPTICELHVPIVFKFGSLNFLEPSGPLQARTGFSLPLPLFNLSSNASELLLFLVINVYEEKKI